MRNMRAEMPRGLEGSVFTTSRSLLKHSCILFYFEVRLWNALQDIGLENLVEVDLSESVGYILPNRA